jgi:hypothetical protein
MSIDIIKDERESKILKHLDNANELMNVFIIGNRLIINRIHYIINIVEYDVDTDTLNIYV